MYDTVIIGAGLSGLAAGIRSAYYDQRVCILERHTTIGGLNSFYRLGGRNYDVGLHAVTNYLPKGVRKGPLAKLLRQLRLTWEDFALVPQCGSSIAFPDVRLRFNNDLDFFQSQVNQHFPAERDNFQRLLDSIIDYEDVGEGLGCQSARQVVGGFLRDPLLTEMLFCPLMFYGGAREHDMDFGQFCILMRSIFFEGLARPFAGIRMILKKLVRKFKDLGGELRLCAGVDHIDTDGREVRRLVLEDGSEVQGKQVLSSAGWLETMRMCRQPTPESAGERQSGQLSFFESISNLNAQPGILGLDESIVFFNDSPKFNWEKPDGLVDVRSGVVCCPSNFQYAEPMGEAPVRVTVLANYDEWRNLPEEEYRTAKQVWYERMMQSAIRFIPDFRRHIVESDIFTPTTIQRFTGHINGAVYGSPHKQWDGRTPLRNLFVCGTDQGLVGIIGSMISGITIANRYLLRDGGAGANP